MTLKIISGYSSPELTHLISKHLNVPICTIFGYLSKTRVIHVVSAETLNCDDIYIIETSCIELKNINNSLLELMLIIDICKRFSIAKLTIGKTKTLGNP